MTSTTTLYLSLSDSDSDSDSDTDATAAEDHRHTDLSAAIFRSYTDIAGASSAPPDLAKIQSFLTSSRSGALSCLICLERIRPSDPTWSCTSLFFAVFHLLCIQGWARQASDLSAARAVSPDNLTFWNCPKSLIPKSYTCYCGKIENPPHDPWILPHSCGEICNRPLKRDCGHFCLLLCHPGPCPACPKVVRTRCFCGRVEDVKRCGFKNFSCNGICSKLLDCGTHKCAEICHDGECPPCRARGVYKCQCGKVEEERDCCERNFRCEVACEKLLGCGKHLCERGCHSGQCGQCPLQQEQTCPCGKRVHEGMACDIARRRAGLLVIRSCSVVCIGAQSGVIVGRTLRLADLLSRNLNRFLVFKIWHVKESVRECGIVGAMLVSAAAVMGTARLVRRGVCAPCLVMVTISCLCGEMHFEVPCGTEKDQKPPKCSKLCHIAPLCRHGSICKPHKCHYGACPPCRLVCDEEYQCGHKCKLRCHGPKPPPNPEYTLKPKKKKSIHQSEVTPGSPCPPCPELVWRPCVGHHITAERMMVCSDRAEFSCDNLCGNLLPCGNHYCTKTCHALRSPSLSGRYDRSEPCEECYLPCQKVKTLFCTCLKLLITTCFLKLPYCTHLCPEKCHPSQCPSPEKCAKKMPNLEKEWLCKDVQAAYRNAGSDPQDASKFQFGVGLLPCNSDCRSKAKVADMELQLRKSKIAEKTEPVTENYVPKRRKRRERVQEEKETSTLQKIIATMRRLLLLAIVVLSLVATAYYSYKGLLLLSDWMNEVEVQRTRYSRI
ncbi:hypothetical protein RJ639_046245 [Escallonia herrerae]|uniref:NF-X1-type domain-containing protein n=1 Tax=Escallonia herrerae TaxID=1293975 RepID=A0AA88W4A9_9ASTE|nr:hypothetical protein RJ639_046245 [Escallonia herrerae]